MCPWGRGRGVRCCCQCIFRTRRPPHRPFRSSRSCTARSSPPRSQICRMCPKCGSKTRIGSSPSPWPSRSSATGSAEVHTCLQRAAAKYSRAGERRFCRGPACQQKVGIVERHGRPATRSPVARVEGNFCLVDVLIRRNCASVNVGSPLSPTPAKSNSIKKARNLSNHALRSVCRPLYASLLDRGRHIRSQRHVR